MYDDVKIGCLVILGFILISSVIAYFVGGLFVWVLWDVVAIHLFPSLPYFSYWICGLIGMALRWLFSPHISVSTKN